MSRRVVGAVAVIPDQEGKLRYFYKGSTLPGGLDDDAVARCVRRGLVVEVADPAPAPADDPDEDPDDDPDEDEATDPAERPKRAASREAWAAYRAAQGHNVTDLSKQALIDLD